jgi:RNA polymerase sigma factor (sigma-70 family)
MTDRNSVTTESLDEWNLGNQKGLTALLEQHLPWIQEYVSRKLGPKLRTKLESWDIVQEAMVQFLKYGPRIKVSSASQFRALIGRIVENVLCDEHDRVTTLRRKISRERPLPSDTVLNLDLPRLEVTPPIKTAQRNENEAWIRLAIELVSTQDREVLTLRAWGSHSFSEIGSQIGVGENAARMRFNRALLRLAEKVARLRRGELERVLDEE